MTEIVKTKAIVLRKIDFGDTSRIAQFYSEDFGTMSAIVKGARSPKSKTGALVDSLNLLQLVLYKKESRDVQLVSQIDLLKHYNGIRDDYRKFFSASAVIELLLNMTRENEHSKKIFEGTVRILDLIDETLYNPKILFAKYFLFFLKEIGYEFQIKHCNICLQSIDKRKPISFNYEAGLICHDCRENRLTNFDFGEELFNTLICLSSKQNKINCSEMDLDTIIKMLENFLIYHVHEFKGLKSLKLK
ncbi:MAG: DNA repair protein RecO [Ignavibacteriae bacterium HGW-Ignavibacteriae-3]|nr:MAG: DNA repair protein RecO [Ignavibacteriae bacterium HGW-Ignavibacteriae-3]